MEPCENQLRDSEMGLGRKGPADLGLVRQQWVGEWGWDGRWKAWMGEEVRRAIKSL